MENKLKHCAILVLSFIITSINAQKQELECKRFEEGLYLNSALNKPFNPQRYIDSITGCMSESSKLHLSVGKYFYNNDDYSEAEKEYTKIITNPNADKKDVAEAYYYLSLCAYNNSKYELSIKYSYKALEKGYHSAWVNENIGLALSNNGDQEESIKYYKKALMEDPKSASVINNIGVSLERMKQRDVALEYYYKADSLAKGKNALYASNIFRSLRALGKAEESVTYIKKVYPKFKTNKSIIVDYTKVLHDEKKYDEVLDNARLLYRMHPSTSDDWFNIGYAYFDGGQLDTSFYAYNIAIKYDPKNIHAYSNLILIYNTLGMHKEAEAKLDIAFALNPNYWYFFERKYNLNMWQYKFEEAYKWAVQMKERFAMPEKSFDFELGWSLLHLKKYEEAIVCFKKELKKAPKDDRLLNNLGRCYTGLKQTDTAMSYFNRAMAINPENSYIYHNRAALYSDLGKWDLACNDLKIAIDKEYNWIIDENLEKAKQAHCPDVKTDRKIIIHEYKGNKIQLSKYNFIKLNDSLLNEAVNDKILNDANSKIEKEEKDTRSVFDSFKVYPNPNQGTFYVEGTLSFTEPLTIKVFNENGALVLTDKMTELKKQVSMKEPATGIYVVMVSTSSTVLSVKKIVVQN